MIARVNATEKITPPSKWPDDVGKETGSVVGRSLPKCSSPIVDHSFGRHLLQNCAVEVTTERSSLVSLVDGEDLHNRTVQERQPA